MEAAALTIQFAVGHLSRGRAQTADVAVPKNRLLVSFDSSPQRVLARKGHLKRFGDFSSVRDCVKGETNQERGFSWAGPASQVS